MQQLAFEHIRDGFPPRPVRFKITSWAKRQLLPVSCVSQAMHEYHSRGVLAECVHRNGPERRDCCHWRFWLHGEGDDF
jgi:hypothetical protein